jgi:glutathione S-transferase
MKLYVSPFAPNPRRVTMFMAEKGITGIELVTVDLMKDEHRAPAYLAKNPLGLVPALELDDGRVLSETRAICTYLEGLTPEPNLMGKDFEERAFIEMADRRAELQLLGGITNWARHTHPALASLEKPQFSEFGAAQAGKVREKARWFDELLGRQEYVAGDRFTIADITLYCGLEFARALVKFKPDEEGLKNVQAWRDRIHARPSAAASK